jgi:hypothetical protein
MNHATTSTRQFLVLVSSVIAGVLLVVGVVSASTTISTDISTGGDLTVSGTSTLATTTVSDLTATGNVAVGSTVLGSTGTGIRVGNGTSTIVLFPNDGSDSVGPPALQVGMPDSSLRSPWAGSTLFSLASFQFGGSSANYEQAVGTHFISTDNSVGVTGDYNITGLDSATSAPGNDYTGYYSNVTNAGTGDGGTAWGYYSQINNQSSGIWDTAHNFHVSTQFLSHPGEITTDVGYWSDNLAGVATNPYYSWFDSRGVRRVKEDSTYNGVGQAIEALYNPQFTKYTPGASDYERIVLGQWNSNVAEIGTQAGGTGTLRPLRLIGASVQLPTGSTDPGCTTSADIGKEWVDTTSSVTTHFKSCSEVSSTPAWVTVF